MLDVLTTQTFDRWLQGLRDMQAKAKVLARIRRASMGNLGDAEPVGEGISEMRIHYGPGYRVYFQQRGTRLVLLLAGGTKRTQQQDIHAAKRIAADWSE